MRKLINWLKALPWAEAVKAAWKVIMPAAIGSAAAIATGCSSMVPNSKSQTMSLYAIGIPGIAVVTQSEQLADNRGDDENEPMQTTEVDVTEE